MTDTCYDENITATGKVHTGAMIALIPTSTDAQRIAIDGGEEPSDLHVTLMYLGEAALIPTEVRDQLIEHVALQTAKLPVVIGKIFSVNVFNPEPGQVITASGDGAGPCVTWGVDGISLQDLRDNIVIDVNTVFASAQLAAPEQHTPWVPHITATYISADDEVDLSAFTDRIGPVTFDCVRLAFGDDVYDIILGDSTASCSCADTVTATFSPSQPRGVDGRWIKTSDNKSTPVKFVKTSDNKSTPVKFVKTSDNKSTLAKPTSAKSLWKSLGDYDGQVIAVRTVRGNPYSRLFVSHNAKGSVVREQSWFNDNWSPYSLDPYNDIKTPKKLKSHMDTMQGYEFIEPEKYNGPDVPNVTKSPTAVTMSQRYDPKNYEVEYGVPSSEWVDLSLSEAPNDWVDSPNIITPAEALKIHNAAMSKKPWTGDTAEVFSGYTSSSESLHNAIRSGSTHTQDGDKVIDTIKILDDGMYALPRDVTAFRSVNPNAFGADSVDDLIAKLKPGDTFTDKAYLSTSVSQAQHLEGPISPVQVRINVPKGTKAAYVGDMSNYPEQSELVVKRRAKLRVNRVETINGRVFVYMDVVK